MSEHYLDPMRATVRDHVLRSTICPDAEEQKLKQAAAAEKHERESAERDAHLASLVIAPSTPISQEPLAARFTPPRTSRVAQARLKARLKEKRQKENKT